MLIMNATAITPTMTWDMLATWPGWGAMWLLAVAIFSVCKMITWLAANVQGQPVWRQVAYWFGWPGLNADQFLDGRSRPHRPSVQEWFGGAVQFLFGVAIFWNAQHSYFATSPILLGWAGMVGVVLMLHFGAFKVLSCGWRSIGVDARPLMVAPLAATSVTEFWGKRWNTAFRDFAHQILFRPLARRCGVRAALFLTFLISGLIHDVVISLPAGGGYGGPTAFFVIQPVAMAVERSRLGRKLGLGSGWRGWLFTAAMLVLPAGLLFHECFIHAVVIPFMRAMGAA